MRCLIVFGDIVYGTVWNSTIGKFLYCERDRDNARDRYCEAVKKSDIVVGHLPRKISRMCSLFLGRGEIFIV